MYSYCADTRANDFPTENLFKIGLEFQESHHLCPWAIDEKSVQNEPIFWVKRNGNPLWHITIDWQDLEFVTVPFSNLEEDLFNSAIETIQIACDALSQLSLKFIDISGGITFKKWRTHFQNELEKIHKGLYTVDLAYAGDADSFGSIIFPFTGNAFAAKFQPQVTIQHNLSHTIPLILGLCTSYLTVQNDFYCLDLDAKENPLILDVVRNCFLTRINEHNQFTIPKQTSSEEGFLFLHMLTCLSLVSNVRLEQNDQNRICEVLDWHREDGQVNAKAHLSILSRRPFSMMWKDIKTQMPVVISSMTDSMNVLDLAESTILSANMSASEQENAMMEESSNFTTVSTSSCIHDLSYKHLLEEQLSQHFKTHLAQRFQWINYADIYFNKDGSRCDITSYFPELHEDADCQLLLKNGIVSTSMIRESRARKMSNGQLSIMGDIFTNYFDDIVRSIDNLQSHHYKLDEETMEIHQQSVSHDLLSPPYFLSKHDSMGAYKSTELNLSFGEAILEFRMIASIGDYACKQIQELMSEESEMEIRAGEFLSKINQRGISTLQDQAKGLFLFVKSIFDLGGTNEI